MRRYLFYFVLASLFSFLQLEAVIEECPTFQKLTKLSYTPQSHLLLLDIDNTLLHPNQMIGSQEWFYFYLQRSFDRQGVKEEVKQYAIDLCTAINLVSSVHPVEKITPEVILRLQKQKVCIIGFTTRGHSMATATCRQLNSLGLNLEKTAPTQVRFSLTKVPEVYFQNGVLYTSGANKGQALLEFLSQLSFRPSQIIYINDKKEPLEGVESMLLKEISFLGLRYSAADRYQEDFSEQVSDVELENFSRLLNDQEAQKIATLGDYKANGS